ncbi:MAG TPA: ABC transporter ATP-binding protein [Proteobacteria bacterium]|nr:ABC transporter ATP-binding protein [Pseudomonadota bacterium]
MNQDQDHLHDQISPIIRIRELNFSYQDHCILQNVNLDIEEGELASIIGPNGGGKTTLLRLMLGLIQPDSGTIEVFGQPAAQACRAIGYMPQHAHLDPLFPISVLNVVLMGQLGCRNCGAWGLYHRRSREVARQALSEVGMSECEKKSFHELSGGQRQRVLIARALATEPRLLLLDEPTANIDSRSEENLYETLVRLNRKMTILLVSHDLGVVSQVVRSVICVNRQVVIHPTSHINGALIKEIYGGDFNLVRHDHRCNEHGHQFLKPSI